MLILAFDTATDVRDERARRRRRGARASATSVPRTLLADVDALLAPGRRARRRPRRARSRDRPGQLHGHAHRARRRTRARALARPARRRGLDAGCARRRGAERDAGRSTPGAARSSSPGLRALRPRARARRPGRSASATGRLRYRALLEARGLDVPPDARPAPPPARALPRACSPTAFGPADAIEPIYVRVARCATTCSRERSSCGALDTDDLDDVERIERASYPTPWSRSMFVAELRSRARSASAPTPPTASSSAT